MFTASFGGEVRESPLKDEYDNMTKIGRFLSKREGAEL